MPNVPVTDPDILSQLNGGGTPGAAPGGGGRVPVSDPEILKQLNSTEAPPTRTPHEQESDKYFGQQSTAGDIGRSVLAAPMKALIGIVGLPGTIAALTAHAHDVFTKMSPEERQRAAAAMGAGVDESSVGQPSPATEALRKFGEVAGPQAVRSGVERLEGALHGKESVPEYEPQTEVGRIASRVTEGASIPGARLAGAAGGLLGEVGRTIGGTPGDIVGSLIGGGFTALGQSLVGMPDKVLRSALENVSDAQLGQADALVKASIAKGSPITGAEAISQVTGGNVRLQDLQRVLEHTQGGAGAFEPIMQGRAGANAAAMESEAGKIAPPITQPSEIAPRVQEAAGQTVNETRQAINQTAQPFYQAAEKQAMDPGMFASLQSNAMFQAALKKVRADPIYDGLKAQPDNSIAVIDAVKKELGETAESHAPNVAQAGSRTHEAAYTGAKEETQNAARLASPDYNMAQGVESSMREQFLDPLKRSATGQLAAAEKFPQQAQVLFNPRPLEGSETEIGNAVKAVVAKDPEAAQQMVRVYLKQRFDELTQKLSTGQNQFGAATFAGDVAGNAQQAKNLRAALEALPNGQEISDSFGNLLKIFEAQGQRARPGSATAFSSEINAILGRGGKAADILETATSPRTWLSLGKEVGQRILYERNSAKLADILTSPDSVEQMRQIAKIAPESATGKALYRLLVPAGIASENAQQQ